MKNKKVFILVMFVFLIGNVMALDFDNKITYSEEDRKVNIKNLFGFGADFGDATITSHPNLSEVNWDIRGNAFNRVIITEFDPREDYNGFIGTPTFKNNKTGEFEELDYYWEKAIYGDVVVEDWGEECTAGYTDSNKTNWRNCESAIVGNHIENQVISWERFEEHNIRDGENLTIALVVYVPRGNIYDGIPKFYGKEFTSWALFGDPVVDAHGFPMTGTDLTPHEDDHGFQLRALANINITGFGVNVSSGATEFFIRNDTETLYNENLTSGQAIVTQGNVTIAKDGVFYIFVGKPSAPDWADPDSSGNTFNVSGTNVNWTEGYRYRAGFFLTTGQAHSILNITTRAELVIPVVTVVFPVESALYTNNTLDLNYTFTSAVGIESCIASQDGGTINTTHQACGLNFSLTADEGSNTWTVYANDTDGGWGQDSNTFTVNTTPLINIVAPTPDDFINQSFDSFQFNVSVDEEYFDNVTFDLFNSTFDNVNSTIFTDSTRIINFSSLSEGNYTYNATIWTTTNNQNSSDTRTITIDLSSPLMNISQPIGRIGPQVLPYNISFNFTATDPLLDTCSFTSTFNATATLVACNTSIEVSINVPIAIGGQQNITLTANDSLGSSNSTNTTFFPILIENSQTFENETIEGNLESFSANVTLADGFALSTASLFYITSQSGTIALSGDDALVSIANVLTPTVNESTNITFNWEFLLDDASLVNLTIQNQTVGNLSIDDCSVFTNKILNFTVLDEEFQTNITNGTEIETFVELFSSDRQNLILNLSTEVAGDGLSVCLSTDFTSQTEYSMDVITRYSADNYANEYYNIAEFELTNSSATQDIKLFDLNASDSTDFKITFKGEDFSPVENALVFIDRQYISEGTFKTVEVPKTDSDGKTVGHFVRNDVVYNIRVVKGGVLLGNFQNVIAFCDDFTIGNCVLPLEATTKNVTHFNYNAEVGIIFDALPTYNNNTNLVSMSFTTSTGESKIVSMFVTRSDVFGNRSICNQSLASPSGSLSCNIGAGGDTVLYIEVLADGIQSGNFVLDISSSAYGNISFVVWFFLTLFLMLALGSDKSALLISLLLSYIGAVALAITKGSVVGLGSAGIWVLVMTILGLWKLNKENLQ